MKSRDFKDAVYEQLSRVASAFSSPKRVELVELLAQGERNVESLALETNQNMANASRHLQVLKTVGLVSSRKDGLMVYYRLSGPEVVDGYQVLRQVAEARVAELGRVAREYFDSEDGLVPLAREELLERVRTGDVIILDVRPAIEYRSGHIAGAISIPVEQLEKHFARLPPDREVVAYCRGPYCVLAAEAVRLLRGKGYKAVRLADGYPEWKSAGLAVQTATKEST